MHNLTKSGEFDAMLEKLLKKQADPYSLADAVAKRYLLEVSEQSAM